MAIVDDLKESEIVSSKRPETPAPKGTGAIVMHEVVADPKRIGPVLHVATDNRLSLYIEPEKTAPEEKAREAARPQQIRSEKGLLYGGGYYDSI